MRDWLIRLALLALPRAMRHRQGRSIAQTLRTDARRPAGGMSTRRLAAGLADVVRAGLAERVRGGRRVLTRRRDAGGLPLARPLVLSGLATDARRAARSLARRPAYAAGVVATLAIGLGASTAMFAVRDAVLLRPLPFPDDGRLVLVSEREAARNLDGASFPALHEWATFPEVASIGAWETQELLFTQGDSPQRLRGATVSPGFFSTLGVQPALGRVMLPEGPLLDPEAKIVFSHALWQQRFGGDPDVVGRAITLEQYAYTVVGVMPPGFSFPEGAHFWTTLPTSMKLLADARGLRFLSTVARLAPDASLDALTRGLIDWQIRTAGLAEDEPDERWQVSARGLRESIVGEVRPALVAAFIGVGLLMLGACANVAALLLASGRTRRRQFAVQAALGAGRARLARQVVVEGLLLSLASAALGILVAALTRDAIVALSLEQIPRIAGVEVGSRAVLFALAAALGATWLVTAAPAWWLSGSSADLRADASRTATGSRGSRRLFGALLAAEFAVALVLVAAAGLLVASYRQLQAVDTGFTPGRVLTASIDVPLTPAWRSNDARRRLVTELLDAAASLPGAVAAATVQRLPLEAPRGGASTWPTDDPQRTVRALPQTASERYFDAVGGRIVEGRDFAPADVEGTPPVVIVNDVLARMLWPGRSAVGRRLTHEYFTGDVEAEVIGVVRGFRYGALDADLRPEFYRTYRQAVVAPAHLVVRASPTIDPLALVPALRARLEAIDPTGSVTLSDATTMAARWSRVSARPRFYLVLFGCFAAMAFTLSALGIHGTMAFWMNERWREMGIRLALGASRRELRRLVVRRGVGLALAGVGAGLATALAAGRFIESLLFQVAPGDVRWLGAAAAVLITAALAICLVLARRFSRLDPAATLRAE